MGGLFHDARPREADERTGLGEDGVALHGEAGRHAARGWIGEEHEVGEARLGEARTRSRDFGHLHKRGGALLHAGTTGDGDTHDRQAKLSSSFKGAADLLAHDRAHRAHHEVAIHDEDGAGFAADRGAPAEHGIFIAR